MLRDFGISEQHSLLRCHRIGTRRRSELPASDRLARHSVGFVTRDVARDTQRANRLDPDCDEYQRISHHVGILGVVVPVRRVVVSPPQAKL
jgi:hypothetical protein